MDASLLNLLIITLSVLAVVFALAMMFIVLWQFSEHRDNRLMAGLLLTTVVWGTCFFMFRLVGDEIFPFFKVISVSFAINGFMLFCFTSHYIGLWQEQAIKRALIVGSLYFFVLIPVLLVTGFLYTDVVATDIGRVVELTNLGKLAVLITLIYTASSLVLLYRNQVRGGSDLFLGNAIMLTAQVSIFIPVLKDLPLPMLAASVTSILFTRAIVRKNLFNPLRIANEALLKSQAGYRQLAEKFQMSEQLYRTLVNHLPKTAAIVFDQDLRYEIAEGKSLAEHGYRREDMVGKTIWEVLPETSIEEIEPYYRRALAGEEFEFHVQRGDNHFKSYIVPLENNQGDIQRGLLVIQDVSEYEHMLGKIQESERFIQRVTSTIPDVIYVYDLMTNANIYVNREILSTIGYTEAEIANLGSDLLPSLIHPDDFPRVLQSMERFETISDGETVELEYRMKHKNGQWRNIYSREAIFKRNEAGQVIEKIGIAHDVTVLNQAKAKAMQLSLEQERVQLLEKFITDATHDLMTPLTTMKTSLYVLKKRVDEAFQPRIERLDNQVERLIHSFQDMLYLTRLDQTAQLELRTNSINHLIQGVLQTLEARIKECEHTVTLHLSDDLPMLNINTNELHLALSNLLINALHYTPERGEITITTEQQVDQVFIQIRDNGIGIQENELQKIFERFYRGDTARGSQGGRSGLGLSISKRIIQLHNGTIQVESVFGEYALFTISLPLQQQ